MNVQTKDIGKFTSANVFPHTHLQQASNFLIFKEIMWQMTCNHSATSATNTINKYEDVADVSPPLQII